MAETLGIVAFLALVGNRLVEGFVTPIFIKFKWDNFFLLYISWIVSTILVLLSGANLFGVYIQEPIIGRILTGIVAGGGSNLLHDLFTPKNG